MNRSSLSLLLITFLMGSIICGDSCPKYKDNSDKCVDMCPSPLIGNPKTKLCMNLEECQLNVYEKTNECVEICPESLYGKVKDGGKVKYCVVCPFKDAKDNCYDKCPDKTFISVDNKTCVAACESKQLIDKKSNRCIEPALCSQFVVTENSLQYCVSQCPPEQGSSKVQGQGYLSCAACETKQLFDPIAKTCSDSCTIKSLVDGKIIKCLKDIMECQGFVSGKDCVSQCKATQLVRQNEKGYFECTDKCEDNEFQFNDQKLKFDVCAKTCPPGLTGDAATKKCNPLTSCKGVLSLDGQKCLDQCPPGSFAQQGAPCKPCQGKISSDGKSCNKECASTELYDIDLAMCIAADKCNKIKNDADKECSEKCKEGQFQTGEGKDKQCLKSMSECTKFISADGRRCLDSCENGQIQVKTDKSKFCRPCPLGKADDTTCKTKDTCNIFDVESKTCVQNCTGKFLQQSDKICSSACIPPQVKRENDSTKCYDDCGSDQVLSKDGCVAKATCTGGLSSKISSDGKNCVKNCMDIMEAEVSGNCVRCSDTQIPLISSGKIQCTDKSANTSSDAKIRANALKDAMKDVVELTINQKGQMKDEIKKLASDMETGIKDTLKNAQVSKEDQSKAIKQMLDSLKDVASNFLSKITSDPSKPSSNPDENKLSLISDEFKLVAEKKKFGCAFVTKFTSNDFSPQQKSPELQVDTSTLDPSTSAYTNTSFDSVQVTNVSTNPHCTNAVNCGQSSFFQVKATTTSRRLLVSSESSESFQKVFSAEASKISKTVCVTFDDNGIMSLAISTKADTTKNEVTCTFKSNVSLYYDPDCKYIDPTICTSNNNNNNNNQNNDDTFSSNLIVSLILSFVYLMI